MPLENLSVQLHLQDIWGSYDGTQVYAFWLRPFVFVQWRGLRRLDNEFVAPPGGLIQLARGLQHVQEKLNGLKGTSAGYKFRDLS